MNLNYGIFSESYKYKLGEAVDFSCRKISLVSAKRDYAAFQVLFEGDKDFTLSVGCSTVFSPAGPIPNIRLQAEIDEIHGAQASMYPEGLVDDDDGVYKADMLMNNESVYVGYKRVQPVWVEISIPEYAKPGLYKCSIKVYSHSMFEDEKLLDTLCFEIEIKNVTLPEPSDYKFHLDLWQHPSNISRKHEVPIWSEDHFKVLEGYVKSLGDLGQKAVTIIASEIPWSGQRSFDTREYLSDLFEYNMARVRKNDEGNFIYDFSIMGRYIDLCFKYGIDREIEVFGLSNIWVDEWRGYGKAAPDFPDAIRIRYFDEADGLYKYMKSGEEIKQYIKALEKYFADLNLIDKVTVAADEPGDVELYRERLNLLVETAPMFKYKTAINHAEFISEFKDQVNDFVPSLQCTCEEWDLLDEMKKSIKGRLLWYVCCSPNFPNTFICSPLLESRLIGLLTSYMGFDGFLRWNYTVWPENPRQKIAYRFPNWKAGDTNFVYPAHNGSPMLTIRYKNLKRGILDFELINMLKNTSPNADNVLSKAWSRIFKFGNIKDLHPSSGYKPEDLYSLDYENYNEVKSMLLDDIAGAL